MSELEPIAANEVMIPWTGEVVDLERQPERIPGLVEELRRVQDRAREAVRYLTDHVEQLSTEQGTKTLTLGGRKVALQGGSETLWDVEILEELLDAGLPQERFDQLVTAEVSYKVNASTAKQIAGANPEYAKIIERARTVLPKRPSLKVS